MLKTENLSKYCFSLGTFHEFIFFTRSVASKKKKKRERKEKEKKKKRKTFFSIDIF